jgi:hypothetical protein
LPERWRAGRCRRRGRAEAGHGARCPAECPDRLMVVGAAYGRPSPCHAGPSAGGHLPAAIRFAVSPCWARDVVSGPRERSLRPLVTLLDVAGLELRPVATRMRERIASALGRFWIESHVAGSPILARRLRPHNWLATVSANGFERSALRLLGHAWKSTAWG